MSAGIGCARMLHDLALEREVANWHSKVVDRSTCPDCGRTLIRRGRVNSKPMVVTTSPSHAATATVPPVRNGFSPLDKQLALLPDRLTPLLQDQLTHLRVWMPFAKAATLLASFTHTPVSESTAQRLTEAIGLAYEVVQLAEVERIERDWQRSNQGLTN
jgi:hypothetical protein